MTILELLRLQRRLTKAEAARLVRMLLTDYTLAERGLRPPSESAASRLSAAFGYRPEVLIADVSGVIEEALGKREVLR